MDISRWKWKNLQNEIMEVEFNEFVYGRNEISPFDFARLLFRYFCKE